MSKTKALDPSNVLLEKIPKQLGDLEVIGYMDRHPIGLDHLHAIKRLTHYKDDKISIWLNVSPRTMRSYRALTRFKRNISEQIILLLALFQHGHYVFGSKEAFDQWLDTQNFFFDDKKPITFLDTSSGVRFVNDRITAMEYGDNV